jgi:Restriction Enzyme Adenine Methylase Associated
MHSIEIDDQVLAHLQGLAQPFVDSPNDVLRRILFSRNGNDKPLPPTMIMKLAADPTRRAGVLKQYIDQGLIEPGDLLVYVQPRLGRTFRGSITEDGWIDAGGEVFAKPSPSLSHLTGNSVNGWLWTYEPTGLTLNKQCKRK